MPSSRFGRWIQGLAMLSTGLAAMLAVSAAAGDRIDSAPHFIAVVRGAATTDEVGGGGMGDNAAGGGGEYGAVGGGGEHDDAGGGGGEYD